MGNLIGIDLLRLDRDVRQACARVENASRALARGEIEAGRDPLSRLRNVSSRASFEELRDLPVDPLVEGLATFVGALTLTRVTWEDEVRSAEAWHAREHRSRVLSGLVSAHDLERAMLREHEMPLRRRELASDLAGSVFQCASAARLRAERRAEAIRQLGSTVESDWGIDRVPLADLVALAREVLRETELITAFDGSTVGGFEQMSMGALGRDAAEGWPAALSTRWLVDLFDGSKLIEGLRLDLPTLPEALGASSFCKALGFFGEALARADVPSDRPFAMARSPFDALLVARATLFASLPAEPAFVRVALGLARVAARDQARRTTVALARQLRIEALRVLLHGVLLDAPKRTRVRVEDESVLALGAVLPSDLAGLFPKLSPHDPARFWAICEGIRQRAELRERFDEDWFQNPNAHEALRHQHHQSAKARTPTPEALATFLPALRRELDADWI